MAKLLKIKDAKEVVRVSLMTGAVPILVGDRGIGKTSLAIELAEELGMKYAHIEGNLLKEGEIGGLPVTEERQFNGNKQLVTTYAIHGVLAKIMAWHEEDPKQEILLFIDELNRAEFAVQQELMNLVLNREINGTVLPDQLKIMCAINPSSKYSNFADSDYQTNDMDAAVEDRMRFIFLKNDIDSWIEWATDVNKNGKQNIHGDICEFLLADSEMLNVPDGADDVTPSPRSWKRFSDTYTYIKENELKDPDLLIYNVAIGDVGDTAALKFRLFLENNENPLITPEEIFGDNKSKTIKKEILEKFKEDNHPRKNLITNNAIKYVNNILEEKGEVSDNYICKLAELILSLPMDLTAAIMRKVTRNYSELNFLLIDNDTYLDTFTNLNELFQQNNKKGI